jgi:hypothetical protein
LSTLGRRDKWFMDDSCALKLLREVFLKYFS